MKRTFLLIAALTICRICFSQSVSPEVTSTAGEHFTGTNVQLSWTIGEPLAETFTSTNNRLTQGFHQSKLTITSIKESDINLEISAYPNPVNQKITVDFPSDINEELRIQIIDINGRTLFFENIEKSTQKKILDFSTYSSGLYLLIISNSKNSLVNKYKIQKIN